MDSKDLRELRCLIFQEKWALETFSFSMADELSAEAVISRGSERRTISSKEPDFFFFIVSQRSLPDRDGNPRFFEVDTNKYEADLELFIDEGHAKLKAATQRVLTGKASITLPEADALLKRVFLEDMRRPEDISRLAGTYYEIAGLHTVKAKMLHDQARALEKKLPQAKALREEIDKTLLNRLMPMLHSNPFQCLKTFHSWIDLQQQDRRLKEQARYHNWLFAMLSARGTTPGDEGVSYLLDIYRRFSELARAYIQALLKATDGPTVRQPKGFDDEVAALAERGFPTIALVLDPRIRHSESHLNTELLPGRKVRIVADSGSVEYSHSQVAEMTRRLKEEVVPALFISILGVESILYPFALKTAAVKLFLVKELQKRRP